MQEEKQIISPIKQRILSFYETLGISKREFYAKTGISRGTLESKTSITEEVMSKILATYPNISLYWLIYGKGNMTCESESNLSVVREQPEGYGRCSRHSKSIPLIPLSAMAGALSGDNLQIMDYECDRYVIPSMSGADFLITVKGDSMNPTYASGDLVACKKLKRDDVFFQWNKTYVLDTDQGALIKRVQPGHDNNHIMVVSDNIKYKPFELSTERIYSIALVVGMIRME